MLVSFALILVCGMAVGWLFGRIKLPQLAGMLIVGIVIGPYCLKLIDPSVLNISSELRRIALIIILLRAGLNLNLNDLKKVGRPAILMCFIPATFEIVGMLIFAPMIFGLSVIDSLILGTVIAAVSPAVIVPHMLKIMEEGYGTKQGVPQMILAGASADDVFVIVLFTSFSGVAAGGSFDASSLIRIPTSVIFGIAGGLFVGFLLHLLLKKVDMDSLRLLILFLCIAFALVSVEDLLTGVVGFSGLLAVMAAGVIFAKLSKERAKALSSGFSKLWMPAEILLFVLVGAAVDIRYALGAGVKAILIIFAVLAFRMIGVMVCLLGTKLNLKERLFCMIAYTPKATVQAAIGAIPLSMGLPSGDTILTVAVVAIMLTAPLGAFFIDLTYKRFLSH
ncbi:MAG: cation:proton antiporter [Oscillospiraceae bacterium]|nr:cation:proton antiporter [Oscillospiraceae bacterium]MBQ5467942.1 cation:proton antiporter [Oscillospiraceae bacterium]